MSVDDSKIPCPDPFSPDPRRVIEAVMKSGIFDTRMSVGDILQKLGNEIDPLAGYVAAWDKYVVVIGRSNDLVPEIRFR